MKKSNQTRARKLAAKARRRKVYDPSSAAGVQQQRSTTAGSFMATMFAFGAASAQLQRLQGAQRRIERATTKGLSDAFGGK